MPKIMLLFGREEGAGDGVRIKRKHCQKNGNNENEFP